MNFHKKEVQLLKSEKETLQAVLTMKTADVKDSLQTELKKIEDEMKRHFAHQKVNSFSKPGREFQTSTADYCPQGREDCPSTIADRTPEKDL